jgi:VanZ family protein
MRRPRPYDNLHGSSRPVLRSFGWSLPVALSLLILYGSLYPFEVTEPAPGALQRLFSEWTLTSTRGDMLGNVALFVPWGLAGMAAAAPRTGARGAAVITMLAGLVLALACQIAQVWVPARDAAMADVFWNMVGVAAGMLLWSQVARQYRRSSGHSTELLASGGLLGAWLFAYWLPLVPSIDLQLLKNNLKVALNEPTITLAEFVLGLAMALMSGHLLSRLAGVRASLTWLPLLLCLAAVGRLFIHGARVEVSTPLGFIAGTALWCSSPWVSEQRRTVIVGLVLVAAYTIHALSPFELRDSPGSFGWSPLEALLEGSMLVNAQALAASLVIFTSFLFLVQKAGGRPIVASVGLAVWVLGVEMAQTLIDTRTGEVTQPLLVLLVGQAFRMASPPMVVRGPPDESPTPPRDTPRPARPARSTLSPMLVGLAAVALTTIGLGAVLRLPGIPYNVSELFLGDGSPFALAIFSLALLWAGTGSVWLGEAIVSARHPVWQFVPAVLAVSLISLMLLWMSVETESIRDIAGSSNLYWFVTNRHTWGATWGEIFLKLDAPEFTGFLELCVRYSALYAPLPICLGLMTAARLLNVGAAPRHFRWLGVLAVAALTLWLCKAIAFDWSSTDNLNELIAREGKWGWGGGAYLYSLLGLICLNSLLLATAVEGAVLRRLTCALCTVAAVPLGWWLLNQGLESEVQKYGKVFSGVQFLLGPDRTRILSAEALFLRWALVQTGATLLLAVGTWLGLALGSRRGLKATSPAASK